MRGLALAVVLLASALTLGCDWRPGSAASETPSSGKAKTPPPPAPGQADMVAAFSANRAQAGLVDLKFSLKKRPVVGEPVDIDLALIPSVQLEGLFARFQVADGLQLVEGAETQHLERPAANVPISHKLTVIARADGIYYITAVVLADSDKESIARTFSIPIIAGQGLAELPAAPPAASVADPKRAPARP